EQGIVPQIELTGSQIVGGPPPGIQLSQNVRGEGTFFGHTGRGFDGDLGTGPGGLGQRDTLLPRRSLGPADGSGKTGNGNQAGSRSQIRPAGGRLFLVQRQGLGGRRRELRGAVLRQLEQV